MIQSNQIVGLLPIQRALKLSTKCSHLNVGPKKRNQVSTLKSVINTLCNILLRVYNHLNTKKAMASFAEVK